MTGAPFTGADFLAQRLSQGLGAPLAALGIGLFPRKILVPSKCFVASPGGIIAPDAIAATPANLNLLGRAGLDRLVVTSRDPRAALDTWATTLISDGTMRASTALWRDIFPPTKVLRRGRQAVVDWSLDALLPQICGFLQDWLAAAETSGMMVSFLRMEDLVTNPQAAYEQILGDLSIDRNLFNFQAAGTQSAQRRRRRPGAAISRPISWRGRAPSFPTTWWPVSAGSSKKDRRRDIKGR